MLISHKAVDVRTYNRVVEQWATPLFRFALKLTHQRMVAEDLVQEAFAVLWENREKVSEAKAKPYLFQVLYRKFVDEYRRQKRWAEWGHAATVTASYEDPQPDVREVIRRAADRLPDIQRAVLMLRDWEGYSYREIGEITGLSESQVKVYLFRARQKMKARLIDISNVI